MVPYASTVPGFPQKWEFILIGTMPRKMSLYDQQAF